MLNLLQIKISNLHNDIKKLKKNLKLTKNVF